jgi:hypothetical protein
MGCVVFSTFWPHFITIFTLKSEKYILLISPAVFTGLHAWGIGFSTRHACAKLSHRLTYRVLLKGQWREMERREHIFFSSNCSKRKNHMIFTLKSQTSNFNNISQSKISLFSTSQYCGWIWYSRLNLAFSPRVKVAGFRRREEGVAWVALWRAFFQTQKLVFWWFLRSYLTSALFSCWYFLLLKQRNFWYYSSLQVMAILCCVVKKAASAAQVWYVYFTTLSELSF